MSFGSKEALTKRLVEEFQAEFQIPAAEIRAAADAAWEELANARDDMRRKR